MFDPISMAIEGIGLGLSIMGSQKQSFAAKQQAAYSKDIALNEQGINSLKQQQMELEGSRMQLQSIRNMQRARAMGINAAVNQGAQYGSGLQGSLADTTNQGYFNVLGINQGLEIGRGIGAYNQGISQDKMHMADAGVTMAEGQGLSSLGGALMKSGPAIGSFASSAKGGFSNIGNSFMGGGSPSGYGA